MSIVIKQEKRQVVVNNSHKELVPFSLHKKGIAFAMPFSFLFGLFLTFFCLFGFFEVVNGILAGEVNATHLVNFDDLD